MPPSFQLTRRSNTRKLTAAARHSATRRARQQIVFNKHRRGAPGTNHRYGSAAHNAAVNAARPRSLPVKLSKAVLKSIAMDVETQLRRSARLATRKTTNAPSATPVEKKKAAVAVKRAVKSASEKTVSLLYPSLLSGSVPGVLKSKIDGAWRAYIQKKRHNAGIIRGRVNREPVDASLNALSARLSASLGRNQSTRYDGPKRHHLTTGNERKLAVIAENANE